jgi:hypothetical protein
MAQSPEEREIISLIDKFEEESKGRQDETGLKDAETNLDFLRGKQWPQGDVGPSGAADMQYKFVMNVIGPLLKRKTALLTDTRPQMEVTPFYAKRKGTAETFKRVFQSQWDEQSLEQQFTRQIVQAQALGAAACLPLWDGQADYGRGELRYLFYDARSVFVDPTVKASTQMRMAEFTGVKDIVPLNWVREHYPKRGRDVEASAKWSRYKRPEQSGGGGGVGRILSAVAGFARPWSRETGDTAESAVPKTELRHCWFKDWERDQRGEPNFAKPRIIRHVVDAGGVVLTDERMAAIHQQQPLHLFDWDVETEHPWGISEVAGLRRIQYTLNRLIGQIIDNTIMTNRVILVSDTDAVDAATWNAITGGLNGIAVRKKIGRTFKYENPAVLPPHLITLVQLLITAVDLVSGMNDASRGMRPPGIISGVALDTLQQAAQSIIRLEARAFEDWLMRIFQQAIALVWQYYATNRLITVLGPNLDLLQFEFDRRKFLADDDGGKLNEDTAWQDFQFRVLPGSSLASTRIQRGIIALNLYQAGLLPGQEVLRASEWPDPEGNYQKALAERPLKPPTPSKPIRVPGARFGGV